MFPFIRKTYFGNHLGIQMLVYPNLPPLIVLWYVKVLTKFFEILSDISGILQSCWHFDGF